MSTPAERYISYRLGYRVAASGNVTGPGMPRPPDEQNFMLGYSDGKDDHNARMRAAWVRLGRPEIEDRDSVGQKSRTETMTPKIPASNDNGHFPATACAGKLLSAAGRLLQHDPPRHLIPYPEAEAIADDLAEVVIILRRAAEYTRMRLNILPREEEEAQRLSACAEGTEDQDRD